MDEIERTILIIDEDSLWLDFAIKTLKRHGYRAHGASTIASALNWLRRGKAATELIFMDSNLFDVDPTGPRALAATHESSPAIIMLFVIGLSLEQAAKSYQQGVAECVMKPFSEAEWLSLVEQQRANARIAAGKRKNQDAKGETDSFRVHGRRTPKATRSLLIVDDEPEWLSNLSKYRPAHTKVVRADSLTSALSKIRRTRFDAVVSDLKLKGNDRGNLQGMELLRALREQDAENGTKTPIIVVSAYATPAQVRDSYQKYGIYKYFPKDNLLMNDYRESVEDALEQAALD